jgi:poly-gamma-glutamate system protein
MIRKHKLTSLEITVLGIIGACTIGISVLSLADKKVKNYDLLLRTARKTAEAYAAVKTARLEINIPIDSVNDATESGLIGVVSSPITTNIGDLQSKCTTVNPNWGSVIINYLKRAGVRPGDNVAISMTGSFPALNIATLIAVQEYGAEPFWIVAGSSSAWGANIPEFSWFDMEKLLFKQKILHRRAVAATLGGENDNGAGMSPEGRDSLRAIIVRNGTPLLEATPMDSSINSGMAQFKKATKHKKPRLFISLGDGAASLGTIEVASILKTGLNSPKSLREIENQPVQGYVARFLKEGVPILNIADILFLAKKFQQPIAPAIIPSPGSGTLFSAPRYNVIITIALLIVFVAIVAAVSLGQFDFVFKNPRKETFV